MERYFTCPHCGAPVPSDASACPECGSDNETGWSEEAECDDLLLYDDEPAADSSKPAPWPTYLIAVAAIIALSAYVTYSLPWGIYLIPVIPVVVGILYYLTQVLPHQRHSREKQLYQHLVRKARGDKELMARLIEHEQRCNPDADRLKWMQDVLYYWERDAR